MTKRILRIFTILIFTATALCIGALVLLPKDFFHPKGRIQPKTRVIIPQAGEGSYEAGLTAERLAYEDSMTPKVALEEGETVIAALSLDYNSKSTEEQIIAYRNLLEIESPVYITYIDFDQNKGEYKRVWSTPTAATRPGTVNLYTQDLIGDRGACVLVTGMNTAGEHTLTVFRKSADPRANQPFNKIAEIRIDGSISVQERERSGAYQLGQANGQSFTIAAYGRDYESSNILDQVEIIYEYNPAIGLYEQNRAARVPGTQIEQRRVRELLGGDTGEFESFINGLWYYVSSQGTLDNRQYLYFDPENREIIFYEDDNQEVFSWKSSSPTRYGLYVSSQNISISNLRRFLNIELTSLDSIQVRAFEDVHLRIGVSASWDGSYRKVKTAETQEPARRSLVRPRFDAAYNSSLGKMNFYADGSYELQSEGSVLKGKYIFFTLDNKQLLELRRSNLQGTERETFRVEPANPKTPGTPAVFENLTLFRVQVGTKGLQELHDATISLALTEET
jgi:hypothetical protein